MTKRILIYDTTLRDGAQTEGISFSLEDKLRIAQRLDKLGIDYIEGGWPYSNPKDILFFKKINKIKLQHAKITAFGSTRHKNHQVAKDPGINSLLQAETGVITLFGKSWCLHVTNVLQTSLAENLHMIYESVSFLKKHVEEVIFDAEHFFDGYKDDAEYALKTLLAAQDAGADCLVLCDTNGGTLPDEAMAIIKNIRTQITLPLGIHVHNDAGTAVATSVLAIKEGVTHIQGTINGYGERCGNADLCCIIPNIKLKLGLECISNEHLKQLKEVSWFVSELGNLRHLPQQPYVGESAFAHKGGVHVSAILRTNKAYEHIDPQLVGNQQRVLISELSGRGTLITKAKEFQLEIPPDDPQLAHILSELKELEQRGYQFEGAEASCELLLRKKLGLYQKFFELVGFRVIVEKRESDEEALSEATIKLKAPDGRTEYTAAEGNGPVNALDKALRKALEKFYPQIKDVELIDYKVRTLAEHEGTGASVRVLIESEDKSHSWGTVGVSHNIIEASWQALVDSIEYKLSEQSRRQQKKD